VLTSCSAPRAREVPFYDGADGDGRGSRTNGMRTCTGLVAGVPNNWLVSRLLLIAHSSITELPDVLASGALPRLR
jgi:hypothetical protein